MAINIVREFLIELKVQTARSARRALTGLDSQLSQTEASAGNLISTLRALSVVGLGLGTAMGFIAKGAADFGENIRRSSTGLGISEDEYQRLHGTFGLLDADVGDLQDALGTVTDRVTDALEGNKTYRKELSRLGLDFRKLKGQNPAQLFESIAEAGSKVADKNQVVTAAVRLFGDDLGRKLLPALVGGGENLKELGKRLQATGLFMSKYAVAQTKAAAVEYRFLWFTLKGLTRMFGAKLAPILRHYSKLIQTILVGNREWIEQGMTEAVDTMFRAFQHLVAVLKHVDRGIKAMGGYVALLARLKLAVIALSTVMVGAPIFRLFASFGPMLAAASPHVSFFIYKLMTAQSIMSVLAGAGIILAAKIAAIALAVILVALALEDLWAYMNGGLSVIGDMIVAGGNFGTAMSIAASIAVAGFNLILAIVEGVLTWLGWLTDNTDDFGATLLWLAKVIGVTLVAAIGLTAIAVGLLIAPFALAIVITTGLIAVVWELLGIIYDVGAAIFDVLVDSFKEVGRVIMASPLGTFLKLVYDGWVAIFEVIGMAIGAIKEFVTVAVPKPGGFGSPGGATYGSSRIAEQGLAEVARREAEKERAKAAASGTNQSSVVTTNVSIDARGADAPAVERLPGQIEELDKRRAKAGFSGGER